MIPVAPLPPSSPGVLAPGSAPGAAPVPSAIPPGALSDVRPLVALEPSSASGAVTPFEQLFSQLVHDVNQRQWQANQSVRGLLSGEPVSLHETMIAVEEANLSFQLMVEVRNRLLEAYHELMRMQV